jgi:hypothetical protein
VGVGANEQVLYTTHFLAGAAGAWWENVCAMQPEGQVMTWEAFKTKFRKAHIPIFPYSLRLIKIMRDKFLNLKQGGMSITKYLDKFTTWGRYAPNDIDTDEKKREHFMNGLQEDLQPYLVVVPYHDLESLVDAAIMVEDKNKAARESRKRRMMSQGGSSSQRSRSMPHQCLHHPLRGSPPKLPGPISPTASTRATVPTVGTLLEETATSSTLPTTVKEVVAIPMDSQGISLRSAP